MTDTWVDRVTADDLLRVIHAALSNGDMKGVAAGLQLLAVKDPSAAEAILAVIDCARAQQVSGNDEGVS